MGYRNFFPLTAPGPGPGETVAALAGATRLVGRGSPGYRPGEPAVAAVRPEDLELTEATEGENVFRGRVRLTEYLGREHDLEVVLPSGQVVRARVPRPVSRGSEVGLRADPDRVVVLPAEPAGGPAVPAGPATS